TKPEQRWLGVRVGVGRVVVAKVHRDRGDGAIKRCEALVLGSRGRENRVGRSELGEQPVDVVLGDVQSAEFVVLLRGTEETLAQDLSPNEEIQPGQVSENMAGAASDLIRHRWAPVDR